MSKYSASDTGPVSSRDKRPAHPVLSMVLAAGAFFLFSVADVIARHLGLSGYSTPVIMLYASCFALALSILYILCDKGPAGFWPKKSIKLHLSRSLINAVGVFFIVEGLAYLTMAEFYAIAFLMPFVITLGTVVFFKEPIGVWRWSAILIGFCGVLIANYKGLFGTEADAISSYGMMVAVIMVMCLSTGYLIMRKIGAGEYMPVYPFLTQASIFPLSLIFAWSDLMVPEWFDLMLFAIYGAALFIAVIMVSQAYAIASVAALPAATQYTQIIWGVLFGFWVFAEVPGLWTITGILVIITAGLLMIWREYVHHNRAIRYIESV